MIKIKFKYLGDLIVVTSIIYGDKKEHPRELVLAIDTGSTKTIIQPESINSIGYSEKDKTKDVGILTGSKTEKGYEVQIAKFESLGYQWNKPKIVVKKLPLAMYFIDGLLGLDFFQKINKKLIIDFDNLEIQIL